MNWLFKWKKKRITKNSADNSNKMEVNIQQQTILNEIYNTIIQNTRSLSKIEIKLDRIEENYQDVKNEIKDIEKRLLTVEYDVDKLLNKKRKSK